MRRIAGRVGRVCARACRRDGVAGGSAAGALARSAVPALHVTTAIAPVAAAPATIGVVLGVRRAARAKRPYAQIRIAAAIGSAEPVTAVGLLRTLRRVSVPSRRNAARADVHPYLLADVECGGIGYHERAAAAAAAAARAAAAAAAKAKRPDHGHVGGGDEPRVAAQGAVDRIGEHVHVVVRRARHLVDCVSAARDGGYGVVRRGAAAHVDVVRAGGYPSVRIRPVVHLAEGIGTRFGRPLRKLKVVHHHVRPRIVLRTAYGELHVAAFERVGREHQVSRLVAPEVKLKARGSPVRCVSRRRGKQLELLRYRRRAHAILPDADVCRFFWVIKPVLVKRDHPIWRYRSPLPVLDGVSLKRWRCEFVSRIVVWTAR